MQYHMVGMKIELSQVLSSDKVPEEAWQTAKASGKTRPVDFEKEEVPSYEAVACLIKEKHRACRNVKKSSRIQDTLLELYR